MFYVNSSILRGSRKESKVSSLRLGCEMQRALGFVAQIMIYLCLDMSHRPTAQPMLWSRWLIPFASVSAH